MKKVAQIAQKPQILINYVINKNKKNTALCYLLYEHSF